MTAKNIRKSYYILSRRENCGFLEVETSSWPKLRLFWRESIWAASILPVTTFCGFEGKGSSCESVWRGGGSWPQAFWFSISSVIAFNCACGEGKNEALDNWIDGRIMIGMVYQHSTHISAIYINTVNHILYHWFLPSSPWNHYSSPPWWSWTWGEAGGRPWCSPTPCWEPSSPSCSVQLETPAVLVPDKWNA